VDQRVVPARQRHLEVGVTRYVAGRVGQALVVLWVAYTATFVILNVLPSDPVALRLAAGNVDVKDISPDQLAALTHSFGLDRPLLEQYGSMLWHALHLDLGTSTSLSIPVDQALGQRLGTTAVLAGTAIVLMLVLGVGLAYLAVAVRWRPLRSALKLLPAAGVSVPTFWVGLLLIQVFSFSLGWFPSAGAPDLRGYVLPAVTMALPTSAMLAQVLIRSFEQTLAEPYVATARAKGLTPGAIQWRHAFRNAALPTLTLLGVLCGSAVVNAVVAETVFSLPGVGRLAQQAVLAQDVPLVQAIVLLAAAVFVVVNLVVDLLYPLLDPRITSTPKVA
jgi:peptide/nickel transport system permease protein